LDLIVDGEGGALLHENELLDTWIQKKIRRDLKVPRFGEELVFNADDYVENMIVAMRRLAVEMSDAANVNESLSDSVTVERMVEIVRNTTGIAGLDAATIFTTSLLVPEARHVGRPNGAKFFHKAIQEHFLKRRQEKRS